MVDFCECAANWRVEMVLLTTGEILKVVVPVSFEFETVFLQVGRGSITFNRHGTIPFGNRTDAEFFQMLQMYPRAVGIYFARTAGGTATADDPTPQFGGIVETFEGSSDGMVTLGFNEIQSYLDHRQIRSDLVFTNIDQNVIGASLVDYANGDNIVGSIDPIAGPGIQLVGNTSGPLTIDRDRTYLAVDRKPLGEAINEFIQVIDGPVYRLIHFRNVLVGPSQDWGSMMVFSNEWEQDEPYPVIAWHHLTDLNFTMDGNDTANLVDAFGRPDPDGTALIETFWPGGTIASMPRYDAAPTFDTVSDASTLFDHAHGYHADHHDLAGNLQLMFSGLDYGTADGPVTLTIDDLVPGNEVSLDIQSPHWSIRGGYSIPASSAQPRIGRVSIAVGVEGPEQVTVQIMEEEFSRLVIPNDDDLDNCVDCL